MSVKDPSNLKKKQRPVGFEREGFFLFAHGMCIFTLKVRLLSILIPRMATLYYLNLY